MPQILLLKSNSPISLNKEKGTNLFIRVMFRLLLSTITIFPSFFHTERFLFCYNYFISEITCLHFISTYELPLRDCPLKNIFQVDRYKLEIWLYTQYTICVFLLKLFNLSEPLKWGSDIHLHHFARSRQI